MIMRRLWIIVLLITVGFIVGCRTAQKRPKLPPPPPPPALSPVMKQKLQAAPAAEKPVDPSLSDPTVLLVKRNRAATQKAVTEFHQKHGAKITRFKYINWHAVELPKGQEAKLLRNYQASGLFERVQTQRIYKLHNTPDDPLLQQQWALATIQATNAWDKATSNDVVVAVIDSGIDYLHPDLKDNLWTGPNGQHGYTAVDGVIREGGYDDHLHGTHVAGTIGAMGNNAIGIAGVSWRTRLISFKFITALHGGKTRDAILCIEKMIDLRKSGQNIRVSNNSWGEYGPEDLALKDVFLAAEDAGIINVCAAGNDNADIDQRFVSPASFDLDGIVTVLASNSADRKASFSNYGRVTTDLLAPGDGILSCKLNGGYSILSGTSMAAPHVAGALAMAFGQNPNLSVAQAKSILLQPQSCDHIDFTNNVTDGGRLNLRKFWSNPSIVTPPAIVNITGSGDTITISWTAGILQESTNATAWTVSANQKNPQTRVANEKSQFFRAVHP